MKQSLLLIISIFFSLFPSAQEMSKADLSITSVTLVDGSSSPGPATLVKPKINTEETVVRENNTKISLPGKQREEPRLLKCSITVQNGNDSAAHETVLIAVIPADVIAQVATSNAILHTFSPSLPYAGHIQFNLGQIPPGKSITVQFYFLKTPPYSSVGSPSPNRNTVSAFIFSSSSDPNPMNNYKAGSY